MDGDAQNHIFPYPAADLACRQVLLAHMDAVRPAGDGDFHVVIYKEGDAIPAAQGAQLLCLLEEGRFVQFLLPQLHTGYAALQRRLHLLIQGLFPGPGPVGDGVEQHMPLIALHTWLPSPAPPG